MGTGERGQSVSPESYPGCTRAKARRHGTHATSVKQRHHTVLSKGGARHYSALAAWIVLALLALAVAVAAPMVGSLANARGERLTALPGFLMARSG